MASDRAIRQMTMLQRLDLTETLMYRPAGGAGRSIVTLIDRDEPQTFMQGVAAGMRINVLNDAALGIDAAAMNVGADRIDVAERIGGPVKSRAIQRPISQDADFLVLAVL